MEQVSRAMQTQKTAVQELRKETLNDVEHIVVPVVALVEGPIQGANNETPVLAIKEEFAKIVDSWNGRPVTIDHPMRNGEYISAGDPEVFDTSVIGTIYNTKIDRGKLKLEAWINTDLVEKVGAEAEVLVQRLSDAERVEVSTGYFADIEPKAGFFNGQEYNGVQRNVVPDHLALLKDGKGACSWEDGCGAPRVNQQTNCKCKEPVALLRDMFFTTMEIEPSEEAGNSQAFKHFVANIAGMSDTNVRQALQAAMKEKFSQSFIYILDVFDDSFVYEEDFGTLIRRPFSIGNNGIINIGDEGEVVRPYTQYIPISVNKEEKEMSEKEQKVDALIAAEFSIWTADDKEMLMAMEDNALAAIEVKTNEICAFKKVVSNNEQQKTESIVDRVIESEMNSFTEKDRDFLITLDESNLEKMGVVVDAKTLDVNDFVSQAPKEVADVLKDGIALQRKQRKMMVDTITAMKSNTFTVDELAHMDTAMLQKLMSLVDKPSYEGVAIANVDKQIAANDDHMAPEPPSLVDAIKEKYKETK